MGSDIFLPSSSSLSSLSFSPHHSPLLLFPKAQSKSQSTHPSSVVGCSGNATSPSDSSLSGCFFLSPLQLSPAWLGGGFLGTLICGWDFKGFREQGQTSREEAEQPLRGCCWLLGPSSEHQCPVMPRPFGAGIFTWLVRICFQRRPRNQGLGGGPSLSLVECVCGMCVHVGCTCGMCVCIWKGLYVCLWCVCV